jgi:hypothetical protein
VAKFLKLIEKLLRRPPEAHFKDIIKVLENFATNFPLHQLSG